MKVIGIGGEPGTGKSSVVKEILKRLGEGYDFQFELLRGKKFIEHNPRVLVLGKYEEGVLFCGTDRLSMIAIVSIKSFLQKCLENNLFQDYTIVFEGDRFFKQAVFNFLNSLSIEYSLYILQVEQEILDLRRNERGESNHTDKFLKGRKTMYANIQETNSEKVTILKNNNEADFASLVDLIYSEIKIPYELTNPQILGDPTIL